MIDVQPSSTLRKLRDHLGHPSVLLIMAGVALVLGLSGPFDTYSAMRPGPRLIYWSLLVVATYATGYASSLVMSGYLDHQALSRWVRTGIIGFVAGISVSFVLGAINLLALKDAQIPAVWLDTLVPAMVIALVVTALIEAVQPTSPGVENTGPENAGGAPRSPALLERLTLDKRGALVSLSVSDHYVDVVTTKGREMLLVRLGDAIRETAPTAGLQVHRSHWVALDQVANVRRCAETAQVTTSTGGTIPVSRKYMNAVREAGLLPVTRSKSGGSDG